MLDFSDYPMIFESGNEAVIIVEIYSKDEYILKQVSILEGYSGEYNKDNLYSVQTVKIFSVLAVMFTWVKTRMNIPVQV